MIDPSDHEVRNTLNAQTADLCLSTPADQILARGNQLRRHRRRGLTVGLFAATAFASAGASVVLPSGTSPLLSEAAAWGPSMVNLEPKIQTEAGRQCARNMRLMGWDLPGSTLPIAADTRNGETAAVYRVGNAYGSCTFTGSSASDLQLRSSTNGEWEDLSPGEHIEFMSMAYAQQTPTSTTRDGVGTARVSHDTTRVTIDIAGRELEAAVGNGIAVFWTPDGATQHQIDDAVLTAYNDAGDVLSTARAN